MSLYFLAHSLAANANGFQVFILLFLKKENII